MTSRRCSSKRLMRSLKQTSCSMKTRGSLCCFRSIARRAGHERDARTSARDALAVSQSAPTDGPAARSRHDRRARSTARQSRRLQSSLQSRLSVAVARVGPTPNAPTPPITRSVPPLDQLPVRLLPTTCPICESKLQVNGSAWECVADRTHYWQHRVQRLRAARQQWIDGLPLEERQYRAEIWQTACDLEGREQFLIEHALKYPASS